MNEYSSRFRRVHIAYLLGHNIRIPYSVNHSIPRVEVCKNNKGHSCSGASPVVVFTPYNYFYKILGTNPDFALEENKAINRGKI